MKSYTIVMPFTGTISQVVEAESKEEAIEKFHDEMDVSLQSKAGYDVQWETTDKIVRGNVFYGVQNDMEIEEEEIED